jgi:hypothetical protein
MTSIGGLGDESRYDNGGSRRNICDSRAANPVKATTESRVSTDWSPQTGARADNVGTVSAVCAVCLTQPGAGEEGK